MKKLTIVLVCVTLFMLCSCATSKAQLSLQDNMRSAVSNEQYVEAVQLIEEKAEDYKDILLLNLDMAWAKFYEGDYETAISLFTEAERIQDERIATSISSEIGTLLLNENSQDYTADSFEQVYINIGMALSYCQLGLTEDALVEAKKANTKLQDFNLNQKEQASKIEKFILKITANPFSWTDDAGNAGAFEIPIVDDFNNSTLANYLSMLLYRAEGDSSNAEVDQRLLASSLGEGSSLISSDDIIVPEGLARVNIIGLEGLIPVKEEAAVAVYSKIEPTAEYPGGWFYHKVAYPVIIGESTKVVSATVECSNGSTYNLLPLENIGDLAKQALAMNTVSNYLRSYYRGYMKVMPTFLAADIVRLKAIEEAQKASNGNALLVSAATKAALIARDKTVDAVNSTEAANLNMGSLLPGNIVATGITIEPGVYDFTVKYKLNNGAIITDLISNYEVKSDALNLVVSKCLK
ncbi:MAG: hypothetical protein HUK24_01705 [Sphaerochaetaceae bacterium]|nr:hypothetical protein [Sphaerochaetaceae bacterium]MCF0261922.1 hypothetical protein [Sphaerochaetaceae bacterium]